MAVANTTIALDPEIKRKAVARAKSEQLPLSAVIRILLQSYGEGHLSVTVTANQSTPEFRLSPEDMAEVERRSEDAEKGINMIGPFNNFEDLKNSLEKE